MQHKGDWENVAWKRGYGKYNFNVLDADLIYSRKDDLQKWLKARGLKTTGRKQELIDHVLKAKQNGIKTTVERETRKREQQEKRAAEKLQTPSENLRIQRR